MIIYHVLMLDLGVDCICNHHQRNHNFCRCLCKHIINNTIKGQLNLTSFWLINCWNYFNATFVKWKFHRSLRGRSSATSPSSSTSATLVTSRANRSSKFIDNREDEINFVSNAIYLDPFYLSRDNPFFSAIDAMPDIRPRKKSIPLVSELVSINFSLF